MTTSSAIAAALTAHFINPMHPTSGLALREVTAPGSTRRIDLLVVGLWPSRGYGIDAIEIKVSKADYQREIANPAKADPWWACSNRFWIAAPSTTVADPADLPPGWGLLTPGNGRRFKTVVPAAHRPIDVGMPLLAAILGRHVNTTHEHHTRALAALQHHLEDEHSRKTRLLREEYAAGGDPDIRAALATMHTVQEAAGITIRDWGWGDSCTAPEFGQAVRRALEALRVEGQARQAADPTDLIAAMRRKADQINAAADALANTATAPTPPERTDP